jgi:hypothetical protein
MHPQSNTREASTTHQPVPHRPTCENQSLSEWLWYIGVRQSSALHQECLWAFQATRLVDRRRPRRGNAQACISDTVEVSEWCSIGVWVFRFRARVRSA